MQREDWPCWEFVGQNPTRTLPEGRPLRIGLALFWVLCKSFVVAGGGECFNLRKYSWRAWGQTGDLPVNLNRGFIISWRLAAANKTEALQPLEKSNKRRWDMSQGDWKFVKWNRWENLFAVCVYYSLGCVKIFADVINFTPDNVILSSLLTTMGQNMILCASCCSKHFLHINS